MEIRGIYGAKLAYEPADQETRKGAVVICPGGGYGYLSPREAEPVAEAFREKGYMPLILYYDVESPVLGTRPMEQAAWAVKHARELQPGSPVFICGFSAGGHLAASLGVHWDDQALFAPEEWKESHRPDGLILCYPVITAGPKAHRESIRRLAGEGDWTYFGLEQYVSRNTPPAFIWHTAEDGTVPVENSLLFAGRLSENKVPFELLVYPYGVHGLSLATPEVAEPDKDRWADEHVAGWFDACIQWMENCFAGKGEEK